MVDNVSNGSALMRLEHDLGLNVLQRMLFKAFDTYGCDEFECMAYNVNLDLVLKLFENYASLAKVLLWSNTERITYSSKNKARVLELVDKGKIAFSHISENETIVHAKMYNFKKNGDTRFIAIGSTNLAEGSNQSFESLVYIYDREACERIWKNIPKIYEDLNLIPQKNAPEELYRTQIPEVKIDPHLLEGLWAHQKAILAWLANKQFSIVNIPPGTGKTEIAFAYLCHLFELGSNLTTIVLVPTTTLIKQWIKRLKKIKIPSFEWGTSLSDLGSYFANPDHKVLVTLYERFFNHYIQYHKNVRIMKPNLLLILDECHSCYGHIGDLRQFRRLFESFGCKMFVIGLSATIDSFRVWEVNDLIDFIGGEQNRFPISLQSFYSHWNTLNPTLVLKPIRYIPIRYCLTNTEMEKLGEFGRKIAIEMGRQTMAGPNEPTAAIQRARWLRGLQGGVDSLKNYIRLNMDGFSEKATIIFVQTNEIAEDLQRFITHQPGWNPESSIYVYDSTRDQEYLSYAMAQFNKKLGFCLVSEKLLSEGFDMPKIGKVILHGSDKSPRDWIQKIGRAIRFDPKDPESIAEIVDVVFCETNGDPLNLEKERYEILGSMNR